MKAALLLLFSLLLESLPLLLFLEKIDLPPFFSSFPPTANILAIHFFASALFAVAMVEFLPEGYRQKKKLSIPLIFGLVCSIPLFGLLVPLTIWGMERFCKVTAKETVKYHIGTEDFHEKGNRPTAQTLRHSVIEILHLPNISERRKAVQSMRWIQTPDATRVLLKAVKDSDEQVRAFAQGRLASLVMKMESAIQEIKSKMDQKGKDAKSLAIMAEHYQEMIYLELVNPESRHAIMDKITLLLEEASSLEPDNAYYHYCLLKNYLFQKKTEKAAERLERLIQFQYHSDLLIPWILEILFIHRNWTSFRHQLRALLKQDDKNIVEKDICDFWFPSGARNWNF